MTEKDFLKIFSRHVDQARKYRFQKRKMLLSFSLFMEDCPFSCEICGRRRKCSQAKYETCSLKHHPKYGSAPFSKASNYFRENHCDSLGEKMMEIIKRKKPWRK